MSAPNGNGNPYLMLKRRDTGESIDLPLSLWDALLSVRGKSWAKIILHTTDGTIGAIETQCAESAGHGVKVVVSQPIYSTR